MKLTRDQAMGFLYSQTSPDCLGFERESNEQIDSRRWVSVHLLVLKGQDGKFWATTYEQGLTESQDIQPFEDETEVEFYEVYKVPVTTCEYVKAG